MMSNTFKPYGYIYITINTINFKTYVGQHKNGKHDTNYYGSGIRITKALNKYGRSNFLNIILCWCYSKCGLDYAEKFYIAYYRKLGKATYNLADGGEGTAGIHLYGKRNGFYGKHHSQQAKRIMSQKAHLRTGSKNGFYGKTFDEDTKKKISRLGWHHSREDKIKVARKEMRGKRVICKYCGKEFLSRMEYLEHIKKEHQQDIKKQIHNHIMNMNTLEFMCPYCGKIIHSKGNFNEHINSVHLGKHKYKPYYVKVINHNNHNIYYLANKSELKNMFNYSTTKVAIKYINKGIISNKNSKMYNCELVKISKKDYLEHIN